MDAVRRCLLPGLLPILYIQVVLGNGCAESRRGCCVLCNPGYLLSKPCGTCISCPVTGYTDKPNDKPFCQHCRRCEGIFLYVERCTPTRNAACTCRSGMKCADEKCSQCESDRCTAGEQLVEEKCTTCPPGTFNTGAEHVCKPWTDCSALGGIIISNGSRTSDVVCGGRLAMVTRSPRPPTTTATTEVRLEVAPVDRNLHVVYIVVSAAALLALLVICVLCRQELTTKVKQVFQTIKQTEEEESCDCHSPVQEGGGEDEPMTLQA
ncbi:tumor necrosis factor receptor superfamily member 9-like [Hyla sarda]|uniref:tumor necrosis factor receptor superfamily member 9-like n=1 Tax=Hyla sarda TaxID=327740 RepID=UPI0024C43FF6|nr:tumor necrosis factor receptor superfamily member 9-like [Hyla sarda]